MDKNKIEALIAEYLDGGMDVRRTEEFLELLKENGYDLNDLKKLESANDLLDEFTVPEPSPEMHARFFSMLEDSKRQLEIQPEKPVISILDRIQEFFQTGFMPKFAYSLMLLIIGWGIGQWYTPGQQYSNQLNRMSTEVQEIREMMIFNLVNHPSASERMNTIHLANSFDSIDDKVVNALLNTLNTDPNVNVRQVTVEALARFADNQQVRLGLINSITKQESPLMQIALADVMVSLNEKRSVDKLRELIEDKDLNSAVKSRIEKCIKVLM